MLQNGIMIQILACILDTKFNRNLLNGIGVKGWDGWTWTPGCVVVKIDSGNVFFSCGRVMEV
jgi:hypothetical protein